MPKCQPLISLGNITPKYLLLLLSPLIMIFQHILLRKIKPKTFNLTLELLLSSFSHSLIGFLWLYTSKINKNLREIIQTFSLSATKTQTEEDNRLSLNDSDFPDYVQISEENQNMTQIEIEREKMEVSRGKFEVKYIICVSFVRFLSDISYAKIKSESFSYFNVLDTFDYLYICFL